MKSLTGGKTLGYTKRLPNGPRPSAPLPPAESAEGVDGRFPAPIRNPEAWPPNYADGYNDALRLVTEEGFARPVAPSGVSDAMVEKFASSFYRRGQTYEPERIRAALEAAQPLCCYCGGALEQVRYVPDDEDEA